jgi:two-component system, LytTR family, sensor kinase
LAEHFGSQFVSSYKQLVFGKYGCTAVHPFFTPFNPTIMFNHPYRFVFVLLLSGYSFLRTLFIETWWAYRIQASYLNIFFAIMLLLLILWEGNRLLEMATKKWLVPTEDDHIKRVVVHYGLSNIVAIAAVLITIEINGVLLGGLKWDQITSPQFKVICMFSLCINLFLHCINTVIIYFGRFQTKQLEAEKLKTINAQAELQAIKNQINPHFLFNNLNVLSSLVMQKNDDANRFIEEFSGVYRYLLKHQQSELVPLHSEVDFIRQYNFLLQKRFGTALGIEINIPEKYNHYYIVPVALQMLVENAIKHNTVNHSRPLLIDIHVNGNETLVVSNNKQPKQKPEIGTQIGLNNINKRFELVTGRKIQVDDEQQKFTVTLPIVSNGSNQFQLN